MRFLYALLIIAAVLIAVISAQQAEKTKEPAAKKKTKGKKTGKAKTAEKKPEDITVNHEKLLELEKKLVTTIDEYIQLEKQRLEKLKELAEVKSEEITMEYMYNPINVYKLIKRLVNSDVMQAVRENPAMDMLETFRKKMPSDDDLERQAKKVFDLQDKLDLTTKDMANGDIPDVPPSKPLNVDECFNLGRMAYNQGDHYHSILWMEESMERLKIHKNATEADQVPILDYLAFSLYRQGNVERAYWLTQQLIKIDPKNERATDNIGWYKEEITKDKKKLPKSEADLPPLMYKQMDTPKLSAPKIEL